MTAKTLLSQVCSTHHKTVYIKQFIYKKKFTESLFTHADVLHMPAFNNVSFAYLRTKVILCKLCFYL